MAAGGSPIQNFLESYFQIAQFQQREKQMEQQAYQFGRQEALQQRQMENAELESFAQRLQQVRNPQEAQALGQFYASRNPGMAPAIGSLIDNTVTNLQTQLASAAQNFTDQQMSGAAAAALGIGPTWGQTEQSRQYEQTFARGVKESDRAYNENVRQFGVNAGFEGRRLDLSQQQLGLGWAQLQQQGELGQMGVMAQIGYLPSMMAGELSGRKSELQAQLGMARNPEARASIQREIDDISAQMGRLGQFTSAFLNRGQGGGAAGGIELNQLLSARQQAEDNIREAKDAGSRQAAIAGYEQLQSFIAQYLGTAQPGLRFDPTWFGFGGGEAVFVPNAHQPKR